MAYANLILWTLPSALIALIIAVAIMGFFSGNQLPVEGKVRRLPHPS